MEENRDPFNAETDRQNDPLADDLGVFSQTNSLSDSPEWLRGEEDTSTSYPESDFSHEDFVGEWMTAGEEDKRAEQSSSGADSYVDYAAIEAIVMVATEPVRVSLLAEILETTPEAIEQACEALQTAYEAEGRGFELRKIAGGYRYQSSAQYKDYVERFIIRDMPQKLSSAALETLAIIAYKQPISRAQVASIRGVNVDRVVRLLMQKDLIKEVGKDTGPGQAIFFGTTDLFLERLGLDTIADLPPLEDYVPDVTTVEALEHVLRDKP